MTWQSTARVLTPLGWLTVVLVIIAMVAILSRGLGLSWDPFGVQDRRLRNAQARAAEATSDLTARRIEILGREQQAAAVEVHHHHMRAVERTTAAAETEARLAEDADVPLEMDRAERLRAHDDKLCRLAPSLDGCGASIDPA